MKIIDSKVAKFACFNVFEANPGGLTPAQWSLQLVKPVLSNGMMPRHLHIDRSKQSYWLGNGECWICFSGECDYRIYGIDQSIQYSGKMQSGDAVLVEIGGNEILESSEDFKFLEIKQGPYTGKNWDTF